jgi:hypothetical protein
MNLILTMLLIAFTALAACVSPRQRAPAGAIRGATSATEPKSVKMHEGSHPFVQTPQIIDAKHPPLAGS